jgi:hypothetical protein
VGLPFNLSANPEALSWKPALEFLELFLHLMRRIGHDDTTARITIIARSAVKASVGIASQPWCNEWMQ